MNAINDFFVSRPALTAGLVNHLWQSSVVGLVILGLLAASRQLSARTRRGLAWLALAKFALPIAALVPLAGPVASLFGRGLRIDRLQLPAVLQPAMQPVTVAAAATPGGFMAHQFWAVAVGLWVAGFVFLFGYWSVRAWQLRRRLLATAAPLGGSVAHAAEAAARRTGLASAPLCQSVATGHGPGVLGVLAPVVLLPRGIEDTLLPDELEAILVHEFVHVRRRDSWWNFLQMLLVSAFWFNPVIWLLQRRLKIETEKSCDEWVLAITADPDAYASGIVKTVRYSLGLPQIGLASAAMPPVTSRLKDILSRARRPERPAYRLAALGAGVGVLAFSGYAGAIKAEAADAPAPAAETPSPPTVNAKVYVPGELDQQPMATYQPSPIYPYVLKAQHVSGQVLVGFTVNTQGQVENASVLRSTEPGFEASALQAVSKWRFRAGRKDGNAVNVSMQVPIVFSDSAHIILAKPPAPRPSVMPAAAPAAPVVLATPAPGVAAVSANPRALAPVAIDSAGAAAPVLSSSPAPTVGQPVARVRSVAPVKARPPLTLVANASPASGDPQVYDPSMLDREPVAIQQPPPKYPFDLQKQGISGRVLVEFIVDPNGVVQNAHALSSTQRQFESAAIGSVSKWRFKPGMRGGVLVNVRMTVPIIFSLNRQG